MTRIILQPEVVQDQASSVGQTKDLGKKEKLAVEIEHVHEKIFHQIKEANLSLTLEEITALNPISKEFVVCRLVGELVLPQQLAPSSSESEPTKVESGKNNTLGADPPEGSPVGLRAMRACYVPLMIPVRIGDITFSRVLVDIGSSINVMSDKIRIRLGYH
ncbi:hypothetical protein R1flu_017886 [Riccia fluitans]|uniref:Aspartic peptidase DDI1-type domain-containing protein n=1 Tax=Riccia fluitans TaxID=41844 RepID=A0ABD1ZEI2_9MARC